LAILVKNKRFKMDVPVKQGQYYLFEEDERVDKRDSSDTE